MMKRIEKVAEAVSKLQDLEDSQMEITLLRSCLALPKMAFSLRCCPPSHIQQAVSAFDHFNAIHPGGHSRQPPH